MTREEKARAVLTALGEQWLGACRTCDNGSATVVFRLFARTGRQDGGLDEVCCTECGVSSNWLDRRDIDRYIKSYPIV
jgi:hypothetical protein